MRVMFDTSVLVPSLAQNHPRHVQAVGWLDAVTDGRLVLVLTSHALAETYSVLTSIPLKPRLSPKTVWTALSMSVVNCATFVDLERRDYAAVIERLVASGVGGGLIYDGLIARAAERAGVDQLVTFNTSHFEMVWPQGRDRIVSPINTQPARR